MSLGSSGSNSGDKVEVKGKRVGQQVGSDETATSLVALGGYKPQVGVLRLVFVDPIENLRNYALIPFPETYEVRTDTVSFVVCINPNFTIRTARRLKKQLSRL